MSGAVALSEHEIGANIKIHLVCLKRTPAAARVLSDISSSKSGGEVMWGSVDIGSWQGFSSRGWWCGVGMLGRGGFVPVTLPWSRPFAAASPHPSAGHLGELMLQGVQGLWLQGALLAVCPQQHAQVPVQSRAMQAERCRGCTVLGCGVLWAWEHPSGVGSLTAAGTRGNQHLLSINCTARRCLTMRAQHGSASSHSAKSETSVQGVENIVLKLRWFAEWGS